MADERRFEHLPHNIVTGNRAPASTGDLLAAIDIVLGEVRTNKADILKEVRDNRDERRRDMQELHVYVDTKLEEMDQKIEAAVIDGTTKVRKCLVDIDGRISHIESRLDAMDQEAILTEAEKSDRRKVARFVSNEWKWLIIVGVFVISTLLLWLGQIFDIFHLLHIGAN